METSRGSKGQSSYHLAFSRHWTIRDEHQEGKRMDGDPVRGRYVEPGPPDPERSDQAGCTGGQYVNLTK